MRGETPLWSAIKPFKLANQKAIYGKAEFITHLNVGYSTKLKWFGRETGVRFQLNVDNVLDKRQPVTTQADYIAGQSDPIVSRVYRFVNPREFYLTTTFDF